jgi:hypothetical protein
MELVGQNIRRMNMKKMITSCLIGLLLSSLCLLGKKLGTLSDILKPELLRVSGDKLCVLEGASISIFSTKDLKRITTFGKQGEGPGEMMATPLISNNISVYPDYLFADGINKIIYYTYDGKMIREKRKNPQLIRLYPVGKNLVGARLITEENQRVFTAVILVDENLNEKKELYREQSFISQRNLNPVEDSIHFAVYDDKIFIEESRKGFVIEIFDANGNKISTIEKKEIKPITFTESHKKAIIEDIKSDPLIKLSGGWQEAKKRININYPDKFPVIKDILTANNKIYIQTFKEKDNKVEYIVLDFKGKILKSRFLPKVLESTFFSRILGRVTQFFDIENDKFYYLYENEDEEEWEVHVEEI